MSKKYFTDALSEQTIIDLTGEMLKEENMNKNLSKPRFGSIMLKIIPAAAMIALVIGLVNILPALLESEIDLTPGNNAGTYAGIDRPDDTDENSNLFIPWFAERNFFEEKVLDVMPEGRDKDRMLAYFTLKDAADPHLTEEARQELLEEYPFTGWFAVYVFDPNASAREYRQVLGLLHEYTDLTADEIIQNREACGLPVTESEIEHLATLYAYVNHNRMYHYDYPEQLGHERKIWPGVYYVDENGEAHTKSFCCDDRSPLCEGIASASEYDLLLETAITPYCDDLLARGLITQKEYDMFMTNPFK